jgi:hypothetical protein
VLIEFFRSGTNNIQYYYENDQSSVSFSSNNNLSFRRKSYGENIKYPIDMNGGEDVFLCLSHIKNKNRYKVNKNIKIKHFPRVKIISLVKQFYNYGKFFVDAISRNNQKNFELFFDVLIFHPHQYSFHVLKLKSFIPVLISFNIFYLFLIGAFSFPFFEGSWNVLPFVLCFPYFCADFRMLSIGLTKFFKVVSVKFLVNISLVIGALVKSFQQNVLVLPPCIEFSGDNILEIKFDINSINSIYRETVKEFIRNDKGGLELKKLGDKLYYVKHNDLYFLLEEREFFYGHKLISVGKSIVELYEIKP